MYNLNRELKMLEENGNQIKIAVIGAGQMGKSLVTQVKRMAGMEAVIVIDRDIEEAKDAYKIAGIEDKMIKEAYTIEEVNKYADEGYYIVGTDFNLACKSLPAEAIVDATGGIEAGAEIALNTILNKKHIIMLNAETDSVIGPILKKFADEAGVIFTGSAGDEPGAVMELYDFADAMGFEILVIGKGKNNKLDYDCTPDTVREEAMERGVAPHMLASFKDGSKTMVEMSLMCNATGLIPDIMGAHGIDANLETVTEKLTLKENGGVLNKYGVVEYVNGLAPGVFAIITHKDEIIKDEMKYLSMGEGPNYVLYRPYHLASLETPLSVAMAVLENKATIAPKGGLVADVITIAKKDLKAGDYMDSYGKYTCYGLIEEYKKAKEINAVPVGLINEKTKVLKDIKKGDIVTYDMVELDKESTLYYLRKLQDKIFD